MSRFNCKVVEAIPVSIVRGKDNNVLVFTIRGIEKITVINDETFIGYVEKYAFEMFDYGVIQKYKLILDETN